MARYGEEVAELMGALSRVVALGPDAVAEPVARAAGCVARDTCLLALRAVADVTTGGRRRPVRRLTVQLLATDPAAALRSVLHDTPLAAPAVSLSAIAPVMGPDLRALASAALRLDGHSEQLAELPRPAMAAAGRDVARSAVALTYLDADLRRDADAAVSRNLLRIAAEATLLQDDGAVQDRPADEFVLTDGRWPVPVRGPGDLAEGVRRLYAGLAAGGADVAMRDVVTVVNVAIDAAVSGAKVLRGTAEVAGDPASLRAVAEVLDDLARRLASVAAARPRVETLTQPRPGLAAQAALLHEGLRYLLDQVAGRRGDDRRARLVGRNASYETLDMAEQMQGLTSTLHRGLQAAAVGRRLLVPTRMVPHSDLPYRWQPAPHPEHPHVQALLEPTRQAHAAAQALALPVAVAYDGLGIPAPAARAGRAARAARADLLVAQARRWGQPTPARRTRAQAPEV